MSYLIHINERSNSVLHPDAVKLFPGFRVLSEDEILFIVLAYDYCSPYSQFTEDDRLRRASMHVWSDNKLDLLKKEKIKNAIESYKSLQYNPKVELSKGYQKKIDSLIESLEFVSSPDLINKTMGAISSLRKGIRELEQEVVDAYQEDGKLQGGGERSFLEKMLKNKEMYQSVVKPKS